MNHTAVLGAGSWGTTLANLLAQRGERVRIWAFEPDVVESINSRHVNSLYLEGVALAPTLEADLDPCAVVAGASVVVAAPPSHAARAVATRVARAVHPGTIVISATKGIEADSLSLMSAVFSECIPQATFVALSGPSFAAEVCEGQPTAVVAASGTMAAAIRAQEVFAGKAFRVYTGHDVIGVELAGALKNVIAIAAGISEGLGLGYNPRAALITRGLAEITRLGIAMGADPPTFAGLAGMGDLVLTTTGKLSRNRSLGVALAQGQTLEAYQSTHRTVAEGVNAARAAAGLGSRFGVELPIVNEVCEVLFRGKPPREGVADLMDRELKPEQWR
jgi:glycerol-3-phosphate dehydrogenase (NAD(P)+)